MHKFTEAGLGEAPFELVSVDDLGANTGECEFCGKRNIRYQCIVRSNDGRNSRVGSSCVEKCYDYKLGREVKAAVQELKTANKVAELDQFKDTMDASGISLWLKEKPHPFPNQAEEGKTYLDYLFFCLNHQNINDLLRTVRKIKDQFNNAE